MAQPYLAFSSTHAGDMGHLCPAVAGTGCVEVLSWGPGLGGGGAMRKGLGPEQHVAGHSVLGMTDSRRGMWAKPWAGGTAAKSPLPCAVSDDPSTGRVTTISALHPTVTQPGRTWGSLRSVFICPPQPQPQPQHRAGLQAVPSECQRNG